MDPVAGVTLSYCDVEGNNARRGRARGPRARARATRARARAYAYDFVGLFATAQLQAWRDGVIKWWPFGEPIDIPSSDQVVVRSRTFVRRRRGVRRLHQSSADRSATAGGGMVGFSCTFRTRANILRGREVVIVANDVTYPSWLLWCGAEDDFFREGDQVCGLEARSRARVSSRRRRIGRARPSNCSSALKWVSNDPLQGFGVLVCDARGPREAPR